MNSVNSTITANFEPWFILINISTIISLILAILFAIIFLVIVIFNKTCHTIPLMLISNSCIAEIINGSNMLSIAIFTLQNDIKQRVFQDALCAFRDYMGYLGTALLLYSFAVQALYRYIIVVYPMHTSWQSARAQGMIVCICWLFCITSLLPSLLAGIATYSVANQACILPFKLSIPIIYNVSINYISPVSIIIFIYFKLVRYVHEMSNHATLSARKLKQARREVVVVRRIIVTISILLILGTPYTAFMFMSFVTEPPKYHFRISILFVDLGQTFIILALFKFSRPVMKVLLKFKHNSSNRTLSSTTHSL